MDGNKQFSSGCNFSGEDDEDNDNAGEEGTISITNLSLVWRHPVNSELDLIVYSLPSAENHVLFSTL